MQPPSSPPSVGVPAPVLLRKLLRPAGGEVAVGGGGGGGGVRPHRVEDGCAGADDIAIDQAHASPLPSGVPAYTVDIINRCICSGGGTGEECAIANIHVRCGWFSSVNMVDPLVFRRVGRDNCLVNDGKPLNAGETISFEYSNSFPYQLTAVDATCVVSTSPAP
ncbi:hypothetical protein GUJ93_ZPchr0009g1707 [Zizania palustris]|uniref:Uncharacterized protein n=1 Tax=Zizania palustris TaxID=103762 RepID=A0A8J5VII6_ZIZPA|nr:hypothetical protein GUJ93_ZPchr0009g1707 [Zizania palustris]